MTHNLRDRSEQLFGRKAPFWLLTIAHAALVVVVWSVMAHFVWGGPIIDGAVSAAAGVILGMRWGRAWGEDPRRPRKARR